MSAQPKLIPVFDAKCLPARYPLTWTAIAIVADRAFDLPLWGSVVLGGVIAFYWFAVYSVRRYQIHHDPFKEAR